MWKYAMLLSYVGTRYCGWQKQRGSAAQGAISIGETIEATLEKMTGERPSAVGSGRTDSGVHATGQVAHFVLRKKEWEEGILRKGMNSHLRDASIQVLAVRRVPIEFHAQRGATRKQYSYYFQQGPTFLPHLYPGSWWIRRRLDVDAMRDALRALVGEHDFKVFQASGAKPGPTVRTILEAEVSFEPVGFPGTTPVEECPLGMVRMRLVGTGFLRQMVRSIAGTLVEIGEGRRPASDMKALLETGLRSEVGQTAPARGLWLERVWYDGLDW